MVQWLTPRYERWSDINFMPWKMVQRLTPQYEKSCRYYVTPDHESLVQTITSCHEWLRINYLHAMKGGAEINYTPWMRVQKLTPCHERWCRAQLHTWMRINEGAKNDSMPWIIAQKFPSTPWTRRISLRRAQRMNFNRKYFDIKIKKNITTLDISTK